MSKYIVAWGTYCDRYSILEVQNCIKLHYSNWADLPYSSRQKGEARDRLTGIRVRITVCFSPLVRWGLFVEVLLWLNQRERVWEERSTAHRLMVPKTTVTVAFLGAVRKVKRYTSLWLEWRVQNIPVSTPCLTLVCFINPIPVDRQIDWGWIKRSNRFMCMSLKLLLGCEEPFTC